MPSKFKLQHSLFFVLLTILCCCSRKSSSSVDGPYFGNGFRNGWADQTSIVLWTRLTQNPDGNFDGHPFMEVTREEHRRLRKINNPDTLHLAQIPDSLSLDDMIGACPGAPGEVRLTYFPQGNTGQASVVDWQPVDEQADYTQQYALKGLQPNTEYRVLLEARKSGSPVVSDTVSGVFLTAPSAEQTDPVSFVMVTCHDYIRKDHEDGHLIYPAMQKLDPDFYIHAGDIEYYDKPFPYAFTEPLMRFKWNRLFALPLQRSFFTQTTSYFMKDDHDALANDSWAGMTYGAVSFERGLEIFDREQFPTHEPTYKTIRWGKHLQVWIVEGRNYRSPNDLPDGPGKTIWGQAQKQWFFETVAASDATFRVLISSTPVLGPDRKNKHDNYSNTDFAYEGNEIKAFLNEQDNFFICTGDRHWQYVSQPAGTDLWEFSVGPGSDVHAGGWKQDDVRAEHRFLRVKGGFLSARVREESDRATMVFQHHDVYGQVVHEESFAAKVFR